MYLTLINYMNNLKSSQRNYLRSKAHHLEPVIYIGRNGVTNGAIHSINLALSSRELIKIKFREFKDDKQATSKEIATETLSIIVGIIGHTLILFKQNPNPEKQIYKLP